jgi:RNA polymerase sigma-70 factor (ECF subfamily)
VNPSSDEPKLIRQAKRNREAFGLLYERYVRRIYTYVYYRTGNEHEAEDLTARVFQRAITHLDSYQDQGLPFSAWLYRIAHNLVANWHRDHSRQRVVGLDEAAGHIAGDPPDHLAEEEEEQRRLMEAIRGLPEERQQLLILKYSQDLSNAEIGGIMGRTEGAIKSLYHRTLLSLREELGHLESEQTGAGLQGHGGHRARNGKQPGRRG